VIFGVSIIFIYRQVFQNSDIRVMTGSLHSALQEPLHLLYLLLTFALMPLNWLVEAIKWRFLINRIEKLTLWKSFRAVLTGVTISTFTPNRTGEYLGRVFILDHASHIEGILITIAGSMAQLLVTLLSGSIAMLFFIPLYFDGFIVQHGYLFYTIAMLVLALNLLLTALYFNLSLIHPLKERFWSGYFSRFRKYFRVFSFYHRRELAVTLALSLGRYFIFTTQFYLLLLCFGVPVPYLVALMMVSMVYLVMTVIPTVALTEFGIRGSVAIYFFAFWLEKTNPGSDFHHAGVLAASLLLWLINLGIPSLAGSAFIFNLRFFRRT
jgi:uncharacterized protein (TIRG00374 family)